MPELDPEGSSPIGDSTETRFSRELRTAVAASGLSLSRLQYHLGHRGLKVGKATLSYWQAGTRQPETTSSKEAIKALEEILNLRTDQLTSLIEAPRQRGRWLNKAPTFSEWSEVWAGANHDQTVIDLLRFAQDKDYDRYSLLSSRDVATIGPDRRIRSLDMNFIIQAIEDGVDRAIQIYEADPGIDVERVRLVEPENCTLGRRRTLKDKRFIGSELIFDRPLNAGDTFLYGYRLDFSRALDTSKDAEIPPSWLATDTHRLFRQPCEQFAVLAVRFDPQVLPVRLYQVAVPRRGGAERIVREMHPIALNAAVIESDEPGHGLRWEWE